MKYKYVFLDTCYLWFFNLRISFSQVRVSVILFSHKLYEEIPLDAFDNKDDILTEIEYLRYIKGSTFTHKALDLVRKETLAPKNCRDDTPR